MAHREGAAVQGVDLLRAEAAEDVVGQHGGRAGQGFLRRLEDEDHAVNASIE